MIRSAVLIQYTRVTDRQTKLVWHIRDRIYAVARKNGGRPRSSSRSSKVIDLAIMNNYELQIIADFIVII